MNANEISSSEKPINSSLPRVVKISRVLKAMLLIYLFVMPLLVIATSQKGISWGFNGQIYSSFSAVPTGGKIICVLSTGIDLLAVIAFYRLLNLYEKGIFFSFQNVRLFRALGYLAFGEGLIRVVEPVVSSGLLNFMNLLFVAIGSPWIVGGLFGIMISFIMEEGCKIREEQELTV